MDKKLNKTRILNSLWGKTFGVMFWQDFGGYDGVLLTDTNAIHTFFVRFPLDLAFLDKNYQVIKLVSSLSPWRFSPIVWGAKHTLELPAGSIKKHDLKISDKISF